MLWMVTSRADPRAARLADRHYSRQTPGSRQFVAPGRCLVLLTEGSDAVWEASWPYAEYVRRSVYRGAWLCSLFRNEGPHLASLLIRQAVAATRARWGEPPADGMITFVDPAKVRAKRDPGRCFLRAGFERAGETPSGLLLIRLPPERIPDAQPAVGARLRLLPEATHGDP